jgi:DNA-binding transcriptional ArsR family regulator
MPLTRRRVTDARDMSALAHPLRLDLLDLLLVNGAMTASEAARGLHQSPSNVSWHLRKLAEHGFVRRDEPRRGRERPWKVVTQLLSWGDDAENGVMAAALLDVAVEREVQVLRSAVATQPQTSQTWRDATTITQARLWLTAEEAEELGAQIDALIAATAERLADPGLRPPQARLVAAMSWVVPVGEETSPGSDQEQDNGS